MSLNTDKVDEHLQAFTIHEVRTKVRNGELHLPELVQSYLNRINEKKHLNAFLETFDEEALTQAETIEEKIKKGTAGKLAGLVLGIKDLLVYAGHEVNASSKILRGYKSLFTATSVQRAIEEDAIIIGRQNCDEFGMGASNENSGFGPVLNNIDNSLVPGGSSGGSAVAVSANLCMASLGTDTGGSVRQPAAFTGIYGLKPTYGRVSRFGLIAYASSFDTVGVLANNPKDVGLILEAIAGKDENDNTSRKEPVEEYAQFEELSQQKYRVAYLEEALTAEFVDQEIKDKLQETIQRLKDLGHYVEGIKLDMLEHCLPTYYILTTAEASSNLARFDGVRYGYRSGAGKDVEGMYKKTRSEGFGPEVKRRIMLGTFVLSASYYDAYYTRAQKVRRLLKDYSEKAFLNADVILMPTTPTLPFKLGDRTEDPLSMYYADLFTTFASIAGLPALNVPAGINSSGIPIGLQLVGSPLSEKTILALAEQIKP